MLRANYELYIMSVEKDVQFNFKDQGDSEISEYANKHRLTVIHALNHQ